MDLTIAELARAVGKSETYVRQHLHREHLKAQRRGRRVFVTLDEAARWARERRLPFATPTPVSVTARDMERRVTRLAVLTLHEPYTRPRNLFTLVRHRRQDALGPWAGDAGERWSNANLGNGISLFSFDSTLEFCQALIDQILGSGTLSIEDIEIDYDLYSIPRCHWAYRDDCPLSNTSVRSPFSRHSAEIIEYWSFRTELRDHWLKALGSSAGSLLPGLTRLGFPLDQSEDRVGNLMIAGAEDAIACDLVVGHDQTLRFFVDAAGLSPGAYRANVWGNHSGDAVIRREIAVSPGETVIKVASDVDHFGFAVHRTVDGQCIDMSDVFRMMESNFRSKASSPTLHFQDRRRHLNHTVTPAGSTSSISVRSDDDSTEIDKGIRRLWLEHLLHKCEADARKTKELVRFQPHEFDQAVQHVICLLRLDSHRAEPLYLADPYFELYLDESKPENSDLVQLYLEIFAATVGRSLLILSCQKKLDDTRPWWFHYGEKIKRHITVRTFLKHDLHKTGFHDRYLITPEREIIITSSLNGWRQEGVTFISHPHSVYRAEAKLLWEMGLQSDTARLFVEEIC